MQYCTYVCDKCVWIWHFNGLRFIYTIEALEIIWIAYVHTYVHMYILSLSIWLNFLFFISYGIICIVILLSWICIQFVNWFERWYFPPSTFSVTRSMCHIGVSYASHVSFSCNRSVCYFEIRWRILVCMCVFVYCITKMQNIYPHITHWDTDNESINIQLVIYQCQPLTMPLPLHSNEINFARAFSLKMRRQNRFYSDSKWMGWIKSCKECCTLMPFILVTSYTSVE